MTNVSAAVQRIERQLEYLRGAVAECVGYTLTGNDDHDDAMLVELLRELPRARKGWSAAHGPRPEPIHLSAPLDPERWDGIPARQCGLEPTHRDEYLGIDRSTTPMFSAKVPEPGAAGGAITRELLERIEGPVYAINPNAWAPLVEVREDEPMCEHGVIAVTCYTCSRSALRKLPKHERREYGVRSVRQWFRDQRAAEFEEATRWTFRAGRDVIPAGIVRISGTDLPRTLFDTQAVVDRETAAHYTNWNQLRDLLRDQLPPFHDGNR